MLRIGRLALRKFFGLEYGVLPQKSLNWHIELEVSRDEAATGGEKQVAYKRGKGAKKLMVKIPSGVKTGTKIRLKGIGLTENKSSGDLYLHVRVRG